MQTGFKLHLLVGTLVLLLILFPTVHWGLIPFGMIPFVAIALMSGAVLPDIDQDSSIPRRVLNGAVFVISLFIFASLFQSNWWLFSRPYGDLMAIALAVLLPFGAVWLVDLMMPRHRGILHSGWAAALFGFVLFLSLVLINFGLFNAAVIGASGFVGWITHRAVDFLGDRA